MELRFFTAHVFLIDSAFTQVGEGVLTKVLYGAFHIPSLDHCISFNYCNTLSLKYTQITKPERFLDFFAAKKNLLVPLAFLQTEMTDFLTLSYNSTSEIPTLSFT